MKCKLCKREVDACQNPECINRCHNSNALNKEYTIFCENGMHYCEKDCLIEEFRSCGIEGEEAELIE